MNEMLAPAKINLFLLVGERRRDGYHPILSLMEKVSLYDRLRLDASAGPGVRLSGAGLPAGENTVEKAARLLLAAPEAAGKGAGAFFELTKEIPVAAGLAGGSSDAAAALKLLVSYLEIDISGERLAQLALQVGADVPFFLQPGACVAAGAGEALEPVEIPFDYHLVLVAPEAAVSTAEVYRLFDDMCPVEAGSFAERSRRWRAASANIEDLETLSSLLTNDLEPPALSLCPEIAMVKQELLDAGARGALMSGSGASVFGLFAGKNEAETAAAGLHAHWPRIWVVSPIR